MEGEDGNGGRWACQPNDQRLQHISPHSTQAIAIATKWIKRKT